MSRALNIVEFALRCGLNPKTVATNVTRNPHLLPTFYRVGRQVRFDEADVEAWIEQQKSAASVNKVTTTSNFPVSTEVNHG